MFINIVIGNPPYQENNGGGNGIGANSLYEKFIELGVTLGADYVSMITKSSWFSGNNYKNIRELLLKDNKLRILVDYTNPQDVFSKMDNIDGGVSYFLWEESPKTQGYFKNITNDKEVVSNIHSDLGVIIRYDMLYSIVKKVVGCTDFHRMSDYVSSQTPFGFYTNALDIVDCRDTESYEYNIKLTGSRSRYKYVRRDEVLKRQDIIDKYKIVINQSMCEHGCIPDKNTRFKVISVIKQLKPMEVCTQTYIVVCYASTEQESNNQLEYIKSKFVRALMVARLFFKNISSDTFQFVPVQDFSLSWTDKKLYTKYDLNQDEIEYIEDLIKAL